MSRAVRTVKDVLIVRAAKIAKTAKAVNEKVEHSSTSLTIGGVLSAARGVVVELLVKIAKNAKVLNEQAGHSSISIYYVQVRCWGLGFWISSRLYYQLIPG